MGGTARKKDCQGTKDSFSLGTTENFQATLKLCRNKARRVQVISRKKKLFKYKIKISFSFFCCFASRRGLGKVHGQCRVQNNEKTRRQLIDKLAKSFKRGGRQRRGRGAWRWGATRVKQTFRRWAFWLLINKLIKNCARQKPQANTHKHTHTLKYTHYINTLIHTHTLSCLGSKSTTKCTLRNVM